uniref:C3H1-type domain-containing protein n=1 Tax=Bursaphelenchus xylophilus TaxID=6326 RepID=A0A1I7SQD2_BURXY
MDGGSLTSSATTSDCESIESMRQLQNVAAEPLDSFLNTNDRLCSALLWSAKIAASTEQKQLLSCKNRKLNWKNPALYKTRLCDYWSTGNACKFGLNCWYAHGPLELRHVPRLDKDPVATSISLAEVVQRLPPSRDRSTPPAPVNLVPIETPATTTTAPVTSKYSGFVYYGQEKVQPPVVVVDPTTTEAPETSPTTRLSTGFGPVVNGPQNEQNFGDGAGTTEARTPSTTEDPLFFFGTPTQPPVNIVETSTLAPSTDSPLEYLGPASKDENKYEGFEYFGSSTEKPCVSSTSTALPPINVASSPPESAEWIGEWPPASSQAPEKTDVENFVDVNLSSTVQPSWTHQPSIQEWQPTSETPNQPPLAWDQETNPPVWNHEPSSYQNTQQPEYSSQQFFDGNHYGGVDYVPENYQEQQYQPQEYDKNYYQVPVQTPNHPGVEFRYLMPKQDPERPIPFVDVDSGERRLVDSFDTPDDLPLKEEDEYPAFWNPFDHAYGSLDELLRTFFGTPGASGEVRDTFNVPEDLTAHAHSAFSGSPDPEPVDDTFQSVPDHPEVVKSAFEISPSDSGIIVDTFQWPEEENDHYGGYRKKREASRGHSKPCKARENEHVKPIDKAIEVCKSRPNGHLIALRKCQRDFFVCGVPVRAFRCEDSDSVFVAKKKGCIKKKEARCLKNARKISFRKRPCKNKTATFVQTRKEKDPRCEGQPLDKLVAIKKCSRDYLQCSSPVRFLSCPGEGQAFSQQAQSCVPSNSVEECSGPTKQAQISASGQKGEPQSVDFFCELKSDGFYRHPRNCSRVVQCFANEIFEYPTCPQGLYFDEARRVCDYKENVPECSVPPSEDVQPRTDENPAHQETICSSHSHGDHVQHPTDCSHFYRCVWGRAELMSCPETTVFNPALNVCDYPSAVAQCSSSR